jgi:hypothetical protein
MLLATLAKEANDANQPSVAAETVGGIEFKQRLRQEQT